MKRSDLPRYTPLTSKTELRRTAPLPRSALDANSTAKRQAQKRRDTGPSARVRALVHARSGGWCEWAGCWLIAVDIHHRLNRKSGGRHGEMRERINQGAWLLDACRMHHDLVTSPHGEARVLARESGWLLREGEDARSVPVLSRHGLVWLADDGSTHTIDPTEEEPMPNYVQDIESRLKQLTTLPLTDGQVRVYAQLVLTTGIRTTLEDVHSAWAVERNVDRPDHPDIVPFDALSPAIAEWDRPFLDLVHRVAAEVAPAEAA